jgi:pteridine reductase
VADAAPQRVALVTGGAIRVGRAIVLHLAARGYRIAIHANTSLDQAQELVEQLQRQGTDAVALAADLRDEKAIRAMIDQAADHFGQLDALVNNAAIWEPKPLESVGAEDVRRFLEVNTIAPFVCCQHAGLIMARQESGGAIVNLCDWAIERPYRDYSAYFPSRGAIPAMTRTFAVELAHRNPRVRVNAVLPGPVLFPESFTAAEQQAAIDSTLVKIAGRPEYVAHAVAFLLENDFITGVCLPVDGGRTIAGTE